jgi:hypothetical protein
LLFGKEATLNGTTYIAIMAFGLLCLWCLYAIVGWFFKGIKAVAEEAKTQNSPWIFLILLYPGATIHVAIMGFAGWLVYSKGISYHMAFDSIPYWWIGIITLIAAGATMILEKAFIHFQNWKKNRKI